MKVGEHLIVAQNETIRLLTEQLVAERERVRKLRKGLEQYAGHRNGEYAKKILDATAAPLPASSAAAREEGGAR